MQEHKNLRSLNELDSEFLTEKTQMEKKKPRKN